LELPQIFSPATNSYNCHPAISPPFPEDSGEPRGVIRLHGPVPHVFRMVNAPQIGDAVIATITIDVIDMVRRVAVEM
jgi:hypothetical protein